jgi:hypothetical protein
MFSAMARAAALGLRWLALMTVSVSFGYGMDVVMTNAVSMTTPTEGSVSHVIDGSHRGQGCESNGSTVYLGANTWIGDPSQPRCSGDDERADLLADPPGDNCATQPLYVGQNSWVPLYSRCTYALP